MRLLSISGKQEEEIEMVKESLKLELKNGLEARQQHYLYRLRVSLKVIFPL